jgi:hypothetical protein
MAAEEGQKEEGPVEGVTKEKQTNRFENWLVIYLPLAWLAQLGNGVIQTITGIQNNNNVFAYYVPNSMRKFAIVFPKTTKVKLAYIYRIYE